MAVLFVLVLVLATAGCTVSSGWSKTGVTNQLVDRAP
jgi:hypothetical protein